MADKKPRCTIHGAKHKYVHVRDVTLTNSSYGPGGNYVKISARGEYKCDCGVMRIGQARKGFDLREANMILNEATP